MLKKPGPPWTGWSNLRPPKKVPGTGTFFQTFWAGAASKQQKQESIVKALAKSDTLRRPEYLKTWFYRILLNESMNHHRRAKRLVPLEDTLLETPVPARDPGERLDLYDAIERLDWKEQTVVRLRFFEDMKLEEIARVTNTNLNTVKSRLYKSLRRLRELTEEEC